MEPTFRSAQRITPSWFHVRRCAVGRPEGLTGVFSSRQRAGLQGVSVLPSGEIDDPPTLTTNTGSASAGNWGMHLTWN